MFKMDSSEQYRYDKEFSQEDQKFLEIVKHSIHLQDGHCEMPLPMKDRNLLLPNNYTTA